VKIVFLPPAQRDLTWFRRYYEQVFVEGAVGARLHYRRMLANLRENPRLGRQAEDSDNRVLPIPRTPFSVIYRIARDRIEIIHVRDGRADH
jgi:plasmid stabilization system protein ParE